MRDFPVASPLSIDAASKSLHLRFEKLDIEQFSLQLRGYSEEEFLARFNVLPRKAHGYLYKDILSNAGQYRQIGDPNKGYIYFGPNQKFSGFSPNTISDGVKQACSFLKRDSLEPIVDVVTFYQQFVRVHPFYDANGRIGRFMTSIYLDYHGFHISWAGLRRNQKWLQKLNGCHLRMAQSSYNQYLHYLVNHWKKFISSKATILHSEEL